MSVFLAMPLSLQAQQRHFPRTIDELGPAQHVIAYSTKSSSELAVVDLAAIRKRFPALNNYPIGKVQTLLRFYSSMVTSPQLDLRNFLTSNYEIDRTSPTPMMVFVPPGYHRAGVVPFRGIHGEDFGLLDIKGVGNSLPGSYGRHPTLEHSRKLYELMQKGTEEFKSIEAIDYLARKDLEEAKERLDQAAGRADPENYRHHFLDWKKAELWHHATSAALNYSITQDQKYFDEALSDLRSMDYQNGTITLDRAVREMAVQKIVQRLLEEYNEAHGTSYGTVDHFFVAAYPYYVWDGAGRKIRAAALVREPSWRMFHNLPPTILPPAIVSSGIGALQTTGLGDLVDFELVASHDPRVADLIRWRGEPAFQGIDREAFEAYTDWERGDKGALQKFYDRVVARVMPVKKRFPLNLIRPEPKKTVVKPIDELAYISPKLVDEVLEFIRGPLNDSDPDMFRFFKFARQLMKIKNARVLLAILLEKGAKHWPEPVSTFTTHWIASSTFGSERGTLLYGISDALNEIGRPDLSMKLFKVFMFRYEDRSSGLQLIEESFKRRPSTRVKYLQFRSALEEIRNSRKSDRSGKIQIEFQHEWIAFAMLEIAFKNEITNEDRLFLYDLTRIVTRDGVEALDFDSRLYGVFEWPLEEIFERGVITNQWFELFRMMRPQSQQIVSLNCQEMMAQARVLNISK